MAETAVMERIGTSRAAVERIWRAPSSHPAVVLLQPLALLFGALVRARRVAYRHGWPRSLRAPIPVISVGNLTVGGSGKTPVTRWLVNTLLAQGQRPAVLHGGYALDEPALHRGWHADALVYAQRDRAAAAQQAVEAGASIIVLDDGGQHLRLARDLDIMLVPADTWSRPRRLLPAGAWREPLSTLASANVVLVTRKACTREQAEAVFTELRVRFPQTVIASAHLALSHWTRLDGTGPVSAAAEAVVVCGIAEPDALVQQLEQGGTRVHAVLAYDDHHTYTPADLQHIRARAGTRPIVTTEKDAIKISRLDAALPAFVIGQSVQFEQGLPRLKDALNRLCS